MQKEGASIIFGQRFLPPSAISKLPEAFGLEATKSWYPQYFITEETLDYVVPIHDISYYVVEEKSGAERKQFLAWY